jgi:hypothetical protein
MSIKILGGTSAISVVIISLLLVLACGGCWEYTINTWLIYFHKSSQFHYWQGCLISIVPGLGQVSIILAVVTWILMMFIK